ncbi:Protein lsd90 [Bienertia sinuspersici]
MEDHNNDDMDSLFEGMVLFTPQVVDKHDVNSHSDGFDSVNYGSSAALSSASSLSSQPLEENLFSDLTVINPSHVEAIETETRIPSASPSVMTTSTPKSETQAAPAVTVSRQSSRKKKRAGLRIGYGRDSQLSDELEPFQNSSELSSAAENSAPTATTSIKEVCPIISHPSKKEQIDSGPVQHDEYTHVGSENIVGTHVNQVHNTNGLLNLGGEESITSLAEGLPKPEKQEANCDYVERRYEQVKAQVSEKLRQAREQALSISAARKDFIKRKRKAAENVELASVRSKEIEKKLEEACEAEDFEMAERLSESLAAAEKEKESMLTALKEAEVDCDAIDSKMERALEQQIAAEEECVSLLQRCTVVCFSLIEAFNVLPSSK